MPPTVTIKSIVLNVIMVNAVLQKNMALAEEDFDVKSCQKVL
jgi:hypothetical protein